MSIPDRIASLFPAAEQIPAEFRLPGYLEQREYLIDGEIRTWKGDLQPDRKSVV